MKQVLHVGCGPKDPLSLNRVFRNDAWQETRLDIDPDVEPDIVATMTDLSGIGSGEYDAIWSSHNLEHLPAHEVPTALREFHRVLKEDGFLLITVPDLQAVAKLILEGGLEQQVGTNADRTIPITPRDMIYGWGHFIAEGNTHMAHRTGFTGRSLGNEIVRAGFTDARVAKGPLHTIWILASAGTTRQPPELLHKALQPGR